MRYDFRVHTAGLQALRNQLIHDLGWPATIDVSNKILSKFLIQTINPRFLMTGTTFNVLASAYAHTCNVLTKDGMTIVIFDPANKVFEDYVGEQIGQSTSQILLRSLFELDSAGAISIPSISGLTTMHEGEATTITSGDIPGLVAGMAILTNPMLEVGHLQPSVDVEFPNIGAMSSSASVGSTFGEIAKGAIS